MKRNFILSLVALFLCASFVNAQTDEEKYAKAVLFEEFTTEKCPKCPNATYLIKDFMATYDKAASVIMVAHHAGFYDDWLTNESDECMTWFYNSQYTYAPAMMFDRYPNFTDQYSNEQTPVGFVYDATDLERYLNKRLNKKAHVSLDITAEYDGDKTLTINVKGDRNKVFSETDPRIFIYVTENDVEPHNQAGAGAGYKHLHVSRAYNSNWGDILKWDGDTYEYSCKIAVERSWKKENMEIVAAISAFDVSDPTLCIVENTRAIAFPSANGIEDANIEKQLVKTEYYTTDGVKTDVLNNGMYIEKKFYTDGTQETKKIIK